MSDRLSELRRQRALIQQHADWLDREIAACSRTQPAAAAPVAAPQPVAKPSDPVVPESEVSLPDPIQAGQQVRRGCFLYLALALILLAAAIAAIFHFRYGDRPLLFMEHDASQTESGR